MPPLTAISLSYSEGLFPSAEGSALFYELRDEAGISKPKSIKIISGQVAPCALAGLPCLPFHFKLFPLMGSARLVA